MNKKSKYRFSQVVNTSLRFIITFVALVYILFPFLWLLLSGFKLPVQLFSSPPEIWPNPFVISNYIKSSELKCRDELYATIEKFTKEKNFKFYNKNEREKFIKEVINVPDKNVLERYVGFLKKCLNE